MGDLFFACYAVFFMCSGTQECVALTIPKNCLTWVGYKDADWTVGALGINMSPQHLRQTILVNWQQVYAAAIATHWLLVAYFAVPQVSHMGCAETLCIHGKNKTNTNQYGFRSMGRKCQTYLNFHYMLCILILFITNSYMFEKCSFFRGQKPDIWIFVLSCPWKCP